MQTLFQRVKVDRDKSYWSRPTCISEAPSQVIALADVDPGERASLL